MSEPTRMRAQVSGDKVVVRLRMTHEMETGQRKDAKGTLVPAWYIQQVSVRHNGQPVLSAYWGPAVSKNPFLEFFVKGGKAGDRIALTWVDNRGATRTDETTVG